MFILPIIHALLCTTYAWALGINCRGLCDDSAKGYATALNSAIKTKIDNDTWYNNGDHVCTNFTLAGRQDPSDLLSCDSLRPGSTALCIPAIHSTGRSRR